MSAPSFSSFIPTHTSDSEQRPGSYRESIKEKQKRKKKEKHTDGESSKQRDKSRHDDRKRTNQMMIQRTDFSEMNEVPHIFYSDRKGDALNIQYGGLHIGDVPKYRIFGGGGQILGLSNLYFASRKSGKGVEVGLRNQRKLPSFTDSSAKSRLAIPPSRRIRKTTASRGYRETDDFIPISSGSGRKNPEDSYRSILPSKDDDSDLASSSDSQKEADDTSTANDSDSLQLTSYQETMRDLEDILREDPTVIERWLRLLSHTLSTIPNLSKNATKSRSEITVSIIARAMSAHPQNASSKILRLKYLKAGEEIWHESKLRAEWEDTLRVGGIEVWMEWMEWKIRTNEDGMDGIVNSALRAMKAVGDEDTAELEKLRLFWRVAMAYQDSGFPEHAVAMFQAQAELTFNLPQSFFGQSLKEKLDELEEFWESESLRIGEANATGWAAWFASGKPEFCTPKNHDASKIIGGNLEMDPYRQWAKQETRADQISLPVRSTDDSAESDPYKTVLFSDIRPLLINLHSPESRNAFRIAWLSILGLHVPGFSKSLSTSPDLNWDDRWSEKYLTGPLKLSAILPNDGTQIHPTADAIVGVMVGREKAYTSSFGPVRCWGYGVLNPLDSAALTAESGKLPLGLWDADDLKNVDIDLVRRIFNELRLGNEDYSWDSLTLAFEAAINIRHGLKKSKGFLSHARESLHHWMAYAQLERMRGHLDEARKVFQTILIASKLPFDQTESGQLWCNWAEMEWLAGSNEQALNVILTSAGVESGQSGMMILRAKRKLEDTFQSIQDASRWKGKEAWIRLRALLELLTGQDIQKALDVFGSHLGQRPRSVVDESMTVSSLSMLYHYGTTLKNPMPPSLLRTRVDKALQVYPSNSILIGIFLEAEKRQGMWRRVGTVLGESAGEAKDVARRVEEVWMAGWDKGRWLGESERTRSGLAAAVEHDRTRGSHIIWRIYLEFEIRLGELRKAKMLLYRAISECPLVKELYLLAFGPLRAVFNNHELNKLADVMAERGIRLRRGLDEILEGWETEEDKEEEKDGEYSGDEIEHNAKELRRLMPYK